jgi:hypothetical protein
MLNGYAKAESKKGKKGTDLFLTEVTKMDG